MHRTTILRGVLAGASTLALTASASFAQEALPTIDVGASRNAAPTRSGPSAPKDPPQGYIVHNSGAATKTDTPLIQTPASVKIIPRAVIEDRKVTNVREALESVSGVLTNQSVGSGTGFIIRGFSDSRKTFRNGLIATSPSNFRSEFDAANVEQIEVLKGPAAMLYGRFEPGGLINIVTKRPLDVEARHTVEQRFGSFDHYRTLWDSTGRVFDDGSVLYRFSGGYENSGSFRDFQHIDRMQFNPSVTFRLTPDTDFTVDFEYFNQDYLADYGIPAWGTRPAPIPISRSFGDPNDKTDNMHKYHVGSELTHRFNENWTFRNRFLASFLHTKDDFLNPAPAFGTGALTDSGVLARNVFGQTSDAEVYTTNLDLLGNFDLLNTHHETLVGFDYLRAETEYTTFGRYNTPDPAYAINIFAPIYGGVPRSAFDAAPYVRPNQSRDHSVHVEDQKGVYFQDHITLFDMLHVFGGGRYDWSEVARGRGDSFDAARTQISNANPSIVRHDEAFSPRVGVLVQPLSWLSVYGNWTTSFGANNGVDAKNNPQPPQQAEQFEVGVKAELLDRRLTTTLAFYNLEKTNLLTPDLSTADLSDSIAVGKQRSKGVEFDAIGKVTDNVSLMGSFTYMDARVVADNNFDAEGVPVYLGRRLPNVPRYAGSFWAKWDVIEIPELEGLSLGFGVYVVGARQGDAKSTFQLPGYARLDAMAAYRFNVGAQKVTAQINIRNLNNVRYFENADPEANVDPRYGIYPGAPLTAIGSIKVEF
ncbi:TonB-dependent siderophore receptor [Methylosinus sp. Sm6]|uniref:TonB-dependent siderophore receptor n=1 Tax=Methylosinus sp. Sm6 TaxID=2866948 RepID=UPI001C99F593|nr:TonB-dependent siderophore receptor [Methylosinus sp. Sm6]MBY6240828.1 TonB-dependent siderophore receptor [Methylosinus sp. Sm6]